VATLFFDCETYCETPITHGTHAYAEGASVILASYAWDDEPAACLDMTDGSTSLADLQNLMDKADTVVIQNSAFDRTILRHVGVNLPVEKVHDTMVQALSHSLPGSLDKLCQVLNVPTDLAKDKDGKRLIHLFCKPQAANRKIRIATRLTHPADWELFKNYARLDIEAMREVYKRLPKWNYAGSQSNSRRDELELWHLDQKINDRGVAVDTELASAALRAVERLQKRLASEAKELTEGHVEATTQRDKVIAYLADHLGYEVEDLKGASIERILEETQLQPEVRELLANRLQASATSPAKYKVLLRAVSKDARLRGLLQFCGASRTGRFGGRVFQPQNLPRPVIKGAAVEEGIEALKANTVDLLFDNVMDIITSAIRGCIVAEKGKKLVIADLSNIEGRMLAWLAGEQWKLDAFRAYDNGTGHDLYKITAASILNKKPEDITKDERQVSGKVPELACGFQGALGAFKTMGALYGLELPDVTVIGIVKAWRKAHPNITKLWYGLEEACRDAVSSPGVVKRVGKLAVQRDGAWLRIRLPSGRYLCYPGIECDEAGKLSYMGVNTYTKKWERLKTYGGKLTENVTQAASRDVLCYGMRLAEETGYSVVLHVHDELICEVPDSSEFNAKSLEVIMATNPPWADGLPLAAQGFETYRYRKED
jgi:DNA polymerase